MNHLLIGADAAIGLAECLHEHHGLRGVRIVHRVIAIFLSVVVVIILD